MLDRDFIAEGALPLPVLASGPQDLVGHSGAPVLSAIRDKAKRIVRTAISRDRSDDYKLSLMKELAQDIVELCPDNGTDPLI